MPRTLRCTVGALKGRVLVYPDDWAERALEAGEAEEIERAGAVAAEPPDSDVEDDLDQDATQDQE